MSDRLNLPELPDPADIGRMGKILRNVADYCERREMLGRRAHSLQRERNMMMSKVFDTLLEYALPLAEIGVLEPIQSLMSDIVDNEMENMDLLIEMNTEMIVLTTKLGDRVREQKET